MKKTNQRKEVLGFSTPNDVTDSKYSDKKCPFTSSLPVKKELLRGIVVKRDTNHSATIEWTRIKSVPKYERFEVVRNKLRVHNPPIIDAQIGNMVVVARTRPLSKTKNHVIIKILSDDENLVQDHKVDSKKELDEQKTEEK